jgi:hypothetical protein
MEGQESKATCATVVLSIVMEKEEEELHTITNRHGRQVMQLRLTGLYVGSLACQPLREIGEYHHK